MAKSRLAHLSSPSRTPALLVSALGEPGAGACILLAVARLLMAALLNVLLVLLVAEVALLLLLLLLSAAAVLVKPTGVAVRLLRWCCAEFPTTGTFGVVFAVKFGTTSIRRSLLLDLLVSFARLSVFVAGGKLLGVC